MNSFRPLLAATLALALTACASRAPEPLTLTIAHMNDTHSALEASDENLVLPLNGTPRIVRAKLGGFARLKTALDDLRTRQKHVLTLHAGDAVQGTLYFNVFNGVADVDLLNGLGVDAMALGNHEFDRGPALLAALLDLALFPVLSANMDATAEPALAGRIRPYAIRQFGGQRVAIIGTTTPTTPRITADVGQVRFADPATSLRTIMQELKAQDIRTVVVLSHNGYEEDLHLARTVPGIDIIVGGHSHTLLGDRASLATLGLTPAGPYPTQVQGPQGAPVLVVQAWKWGEALGEITVRFDAAGQVMGYTAAPKLLVGESFRLGETPVAASSPEYTAIQAALKASGLARTYPEDPAMLRTLAPYASKVAAFQNAPIGARASVDLIRGTRTDPGPLVADAYLAKIPGAQVALVGAGGIRRDIFKGEITEGMVMSVAPFGNTLLTLDITGAELAQTLEESVDFRLCVRPPHNGDLKKMLVIHSAGLSYAIHPLRPKGSRIHSLRLRQANGAGAPLDPAATYRLVTNSFLAGGGDGLATLKGIHAGRVDTGYLEHEVLSEHLTRLGARGDIQAPAPRVVIVLPPATPVGPQSALTKRAGTGWTLAA